jgi:cell division protein FtsL
MIPSLGKNRYGSLTLIYNLFSMPLTEEEKRKIEEEERDRVQLRIVRQKMDRSYCTKSIFSVLVVLIAVFFILKVMSSFPVNQNATETEKVVTIDPSNNEANTQNVQNNTVQEYANLMMTASSHTISATVALTKGWDLFRKYDFYGAQGYLSQAEIQYQDAKNIVSGINNVPQGLEENYRLYKQALDKYVMATSMLLNGAIKSDPTNRNQAISILNDGSRLENEATQALNKFKGNENNDVSY